MQLCDVSYFVIAAAVFAKAEIAEAVFPYSVSGPLQPSVHHIHQTPQQTEQPATAVSVRVQKHPGEESHVEKLPGFNEPNAAAGGFPLTPAEKAGIASGSYTPTWEQEVGAVTGLVPLPQQAGEAPSLLYPGAVAPNLPAMSKTELAQLGFSDSVQQLYRSLWVAAILGLSYAGLLVPATWVSFTARSSVMRHWYGALIPAAAMWFLSTQVFLIAFRIPGIIAFFLSKFIAATAGMLGFRQPQVGWVIGFITSGCILAQLGRVVLDVSNKSNLLYTVPLILVGCFVAELLCIEATQSFLTAFTSAFMSTASVSFLLTFFGLQKTSPFDFVGFWSLSSLQLQSLLAPKLLLGYWFVLTIVGMVTQLLRTKQDLTVPFPFIGSIVMGYSKN